MDMDDHTQHQPSSEPELREEPFKIVGQLVACTKDAEGNIVGERVAGQVVLYASQFDRAAEMVREAWDARDQPAA